MPTELIQAAAQFGVAGLMGVLWVWERLYSRRREIQLEQAHRLLTAERQELQALIDLVKQNTAAIERFDRTQNQLAELLERIRHDLKQAA